MPVRIQRKRTKGWKMPENTVSVTRPGYWGNPFKVGDFVRIGKGGPGFGFIKTSKEYATDSYRELKTPEDVVEAFREYATNYPYRGIEKLKGKNLACWCKVGDPCHADILLKLANQ